MLLLIVASVIVCSCWLPYQSHSWGWRAGRRASQKHQTTKDCNTLGQKVSSIERRVKQGLGSITVVTELIK